MRYWWFFLSQGNRWTRYLAHHKMRRLKLCRNLGRFGRLSPAAVHSVDSRFDSRVKWRINVSSIVKYLCKNPFLLRWNRCNQCSESSTRCCFWSTVSNRRTHFEQFSHWQMFIRQLHSLKKEGIYSLIMFYPYWYFDSVQFHCPRHRSNLLFINYSHWYMLFYHFFFEWLEIIRHKIIKD